jgi:lipocalin-like protein
VKPEALAPPGPDLKSAVIGCWKLVSREDYDREGGRNIDPILGADPIGILTFASGHFAAQFMNRNNGGPVSAGSTASPWAGAPASSLPKPLNNSVAVNGYDAYFGTYTLDAAAGTITTTLEGSVAPANIGVTLTRDIRVEGDRLIIRLDTTAFDGTPITRTNTFERLP